MRQVFLDTETTGLSAEAGDRVVEIGCVEMLNRRLSGRNLHYYLNPQRSSHEDAYKVHGLSDEFLADKPLFATIADELLDYLGSAEVIIHNAEFDIGFLNSELERAGKPRVESVVAQVTDSLLLAREAYPGKSNSLDALCRRLEVDNSSRNLHGALLDAGLLAEVYIRMTRGQESLVIDPEDRVAASEDVETLDFGSLVLPVILALDDELAAHEAVLAEIDKVSGGQAVWRRLAA
jgi:DNA polymerase-3 subunit epsilon